MILEFLALNCARHFTAGEVFSALKKSRRAVGMATICRYLDELMYAGMLRKYVPQAMSMWKISAPVIAA